MTLPELSTQPETIPTPSADVWMALRESRGIAEIPRLVYRLPRLMGEPKGDGAPVLVIPGLGANDHSLLPLRAYLRALGYAPSGWGLGRNGGDVRKLLPQLVSKVQALATESGAPIALIGWSLGGYLAREIAREEPSIVRRVITLGSPVVGGPKYTAAAKRFSELGFDLDAIEAEVASRDAVPIRVPVTAIFSRRDAVVAWRACIDECSPQVEHVEVRATHIGLVLSPDVYRKVARELANPVH